MSFAEVLWRDRTVSIEYRWIRSATSPRAPIWVMLHEGLGSLSMWRDFPLQLSQVLQADVLVYSRPGYGQSSVRESKESWGTDFLRQQADEVLPELLKTLGLVAPVCLLGHSDGASIALLYAAKFAAHGVVAIAPHIMVEPISLRSIALSREAYLKGDLALKLARHHRNTDSAFWGWNDAWLNPAFASWSIEQELSKITCPVLAVQGLNDEYGTLQQIRGIATRCPQAQLLELVDCGHAVHKDQSKKLLAAIQQFSQILAE